MKSSHSPFARTAAIAAVALAALGTASVAQARSDVFFSLGANIAPGVTLGVSNARPYYAPPVYVQPAPVYYEPAPVYYQPAPVYYRPAPVYYEQAPVYYQPQRAYYPSSSVYVTPRVSTVTYVAPAWYQGRHHGHGYRY
jgi:hypothetical protein